jgi:hypothetical protein
MAILTALIPLLISLGKIVAEYATANAEQRKALIAQADADFEQCKATVLGLAVQVTANDAAADAIADSKPSAVATSAEEITKS